ncbi:DUF5946 family protein [Geodermatophilus sp. URMC 64]
MPAPSSTAVACPGCGAVLAAVPEDGRAHPGASASCTRLFEVTLRGLREDAAADPRAGAAVQLADDAYAVQHADGGAGDALERLGARFGLDLSTGRRPAAWQSTIADVAADLDVIDLPVLVGTWARTVVEDWSTSHR